MTGAGVGVVPHALEETAVPPPAEEGLDEDEPRADKDSQDGRDRDHAPTVPVGAGDRPGAALRAAHLSCLEMKALQWGVRPEPQPQPGRDNDLLRPHLP